MSTPPAPDAPASEAFPDEFVDSESQDPAALPAPAGLAASAGAAADAAGVDPAALDHPPQAVPVVRYDVLEDQASGTKAFRLRAPAALLTVGATVQVHTSAGKVREEVVGDRISGPDDHGLVVHARVERARKLTGRDGHIIFRKLPPELAQQHGVSYCLVGPPDAFQAGQAVRATKSNGTTEDVTPAVELPGLCEDGWAAWALAIRSGPAGLSREAIRFVKLENAQGGTWSLVGPAPKLQPGAKVTALRSDLTEVEVTVGERLAEIPPDLAQHAIDRSAGKAGRASAARGSAPSGAAPPAAA